MQQEKSRQQHIKDLDEKETELEEMRYTTQKRVGIVALLEKLNFIHSVHTLATWRVYMNIKKKPGYLCHLGECTCL